MVSQGHSGLTTYPCGFVIHPTMGWLGASPDAKVFDPSFQPHNGIAEFKCPYSKCDKSPLESCDDPSVYVAGITDTFNFDMTINTTTRCNCNCLYARSSVGATFACTPLEVLLYKEVFQTSSGSPNTFLNWMITSLATCFLKL